MSRSYRKFTMRRQTLWGHNSMKAGKQYANRKIRRKLKDPNVDISNGRYYRFLGLDSWDLWEYKSWYTEKEIIEDWYRQKAEVENGVKSWKAKWLMKYSLEESIADWKRHYKCK